MTTLKFETLDLVPEGPLRDAATEGDDGKFSVKVEPASKVTEFRDSNVALSKERDGLAAQMTKYEAVTGVPIADIEKLDDFATLLTALRETKKNVDDGKLVENTSLEEAAAKRVTDVTKDFTAQLAESARERDAHKDRADKADARSDGMMVENAVRIAASDPDVGMLDNAVRLVLTEAKETFRVLEGKMVPKSPDGTILYGSDGVNAMTVKEWLLKQREGQDFLFKGSKGGNADGASGGAGMDGMTDAKLAEMTPANRINWYRQQQARAGA